MLRLILAAILAIGITWPAGAQPQAEAGAAPTSLDVQLEVPDWVQAWLSASEAALLLAAVDGPDTGRQPLPEATDALQAYLDQGGGDPRLYGLLGQLYLRRGLPSRALPNLQRAIPSAQYSSDPAAQAKPRLVDVLTNYYLGRAGLASNPSAARSLLSEVVSTMPLLAPELSVQPAAQYVLMKAAFLSGNIEAYTQASFRLAVMSQASPLLPLSQGEYELFLGNATQAARSFQSAVEFDHSLADAWLGLAEARHLQGNDNAAKAALRNALDCAAGRLDVLAETGTQRLLLGDSAGAEEAFRLALASAPEDADVLAALGRAYLKAGNPSAAISYLTRAQDNADNPLLACDLARATMLNKNHEVATEALEQARAALPNEPEVLLLSAQLAEAQGQSPVARAYFQQASTVGGLEADIAFAEFLGSQNDSSTSGTWETLITEHATDPRAWLARAKWLLADNKAAEAVTDCAKVVELAPTCDDAETIWAQALAAIGEVAGAAEHYDHAIELDPSPDLYLAAIELANKTPALSNKLDGYWAALLKAYPEHTSVLVADGERLLENGSYSAAVAALARAAEAMPDDPKITARYGTALVGAGNTVEALKQFKRSLSLEYDPSVAGELASALVEAGQASAAEQLWHELMIDYPKDAGLAMQYGLALFSAGEYGNALEQYLRGQQLDPTNDQFHNRAGLCLFRLGRLGEALGEVQAALELREDPQYYLNLAVGYEQFNDVANAEKYYRTGLERYPEHTELEEAYTGFLVRQGQTAGALQRLWDAALVANSFELYQRIYALAMQAGDPYTAEQACLAQLRLEPNNLIAIQNYCVLLGDHRRWEELASYMAVLERQLDVIEHTQLLHELTNTWIARGQSKSAQELIERLLSASPQRGAYYAAVAWLHLGNQDYAGALDTVKRGLNDAGRSFVLRYLEAMLTAQLFGAGSALPLAQALLDDPTADTGAYVLCAQLLGETGRLDELAKVAQDGLAIYPGSSELLEQLARSYYYAHDYGSAKQLLEDSAFANVEFAGRAELLGHCYLANGNHVKAAGFLLQATELLPEDAGVWAALGQARYFLGEYEDARAALTQALACDKYNANAHVWLSFVLLEQHDNSGAAAVLEEAKSITADKETLAWLALARARIALSQGDRAGARLALDEAVAYGMRLPQFAALYERTRREAGLVS